MAIITSHKWNKLIQCQEAYYTAQMQLLLQDVEYFIANPWKVLKDDPTSTVVVIKIDNQFLVVKRANTKNGFHVLRRLFSVSRAQKNWQNAQKLLDIGIQTFSPVALIEERCGPLRGRSYFICTYIEGTIALNYFQHINLNSPWQEVASSIKSMISALAQHWISHRDLNLSNIILVNNQPWLIDLDSMRQHHWYFIATRGARREEERFMKNWLDATGLLPETPILFKFIFNHATLPQH